MTVQLSVTKLGIQLYKMKSSHAALRRRNAIACCSGGPISSWVWLLVVPGCFGRRCIIALHDCFVFVVITIIIDDSVEAIREFLLENSFVIIGVSDSDLQLVTFKRVLRMNVVGFPRVIVWIPAMK